MSDFINQTANLFTGENTATLIELERMLKGFRNVGMTDEAKIPLSYIISALYKNVPANLEKNMKDIKTQGYIEGYRDAEAKYKGDDEDENGKKA